MKATAQAWTPTDLESQVIASVNEEVGRPGPLWPVLGHGVKLWLKPSSFSSSGGEWHSLHCAQQGEMTGSPCDHWDKARRLATPQKSVSRSGDRPGRLSHSRMFSASKPNGELVK